ncbi:hypothetical protein [Nonomuraea bangladeshensis]|uniref:hypothetical protein n=1 Tax=Nonomuraea bangladeshensis TaxID=404385 RepID=UPI003C2CC025
MSEYVLRLTHSSLNEHVQKLVEENRDKLIRAAVPDREIQRQLLELNERIEALNDCDPEIPRAWGLGCGAHCALPEVRVFDTTPTNNSTTAY